MWDGVNMTPHHSVTFIGNTRESMGGNIFWEKKAYKLLMEWYDKNLALLDRHKWCLSKMLLDIYEHLTSPQKSRFVGRNLTYITTVGTKVSEVSP